MTTHIKTGEDYKGRFTIAYGGRGRISWLREPDCSRYFDALRGAPAGQAGAAGGALGSAGDLLLGASNVIGTVAHVAQAVGSLLQWWELRQARLHRELQQENDLRLRLVSDFLDRWVLEHSTQDHVDLEMSHFLAREAMGLLRLASESEKVVIPQATLYELERVRAVVGGARATLVRQLVQLQASGVTELASPIDGGSPQRLNFDALARFYDPPEEEWNRAVAEKSARSFEAELLKTARNPAEIARRVFIVRDDDEAALLGVLSSETRPIWSDIAKAFVLLNATRLVAPVPMFAVGILTPFVIAQIDKWKEEKNLERKDAVRELILFASEVERTRLLVRCWDMIQTTVEVSRGSRLLCLEEAGRPTLAALDDQGNLRPVEHGMLTKRLLPASITRAASSGPLLLPAKGEGRT